MKSDNWNDTQKLLAFILVIAFIVVIIIWMFLPPKGDAGIMAVLNTLVGTLGGMTGTVVTFYFGSSQGSKSKDDALNSIAVKTTGNGEIPHAPTP